MDQAAHYASLVLSGEEPCALSARLTFERHLNDLERMKQGWHWQYDVSRADRIMAFASELTLSDGQWEGQPWKPHPWQEFLLRTAFGWVGPDGNRRFRKVYCETPKGSGKKVISAAIALYMLHLDGEGRPEIYCLAETGDQAQIIFDCTRQIMDRSEDLSAWGYVYGGDVVPNRIMSHEGGFIRRVDRAQGGRGRSGFLPSAILVDELHEIRDTGLIDLYEAGTKLRQQPLTFLTTNTGAGAAQGTPCWTEHSHALRIAKGDVLDERYLPLVYELDRELDDEIFERRDLWPAFNPSLPDTPGYEYIEDRIRKAAVSPSARAEVLRLNFGRWSDAANPWLNVQAWKAVQTEPEDMPPPSDRVVVAFDLSTRTDLTGGAVAWEAEDGKVAVRAMGWTPEEGLEQRAQTDAADYLRWIQDGHLISTPGRIVDYSIIAEWLADLVGSDHGVRCVGTDTFGRTHFRKALEDLGMEVVGSFQESGGEDLILIYHPQGFAENMKKQEENRGDGEIYPSMPVSINDFEELVAKELLIVQKSPALTSAVLSACTIVDNHSNRKFAKTKSYARIDLCVAATCAVGILMQLREGDDMGDMSEWMVV